jgi:hypothetical protein
MDWRSSKIFPPVLGQYSYIRAVLSLILILPGQLFVISCVIWRHSSITMALKCFPCAILLFAQFLIACVGPWVSVILPFDLEVPPIVKTNEGELRRSLSPSISGIYRDHYFSLSNLKPTPFTFPNKPVIPSYEPRLLACLQPLRNG